MACDSPELPADGPQPGDIDRIESPRRLTMRESSTPCKVDSLVQTGSKKVIYNRYLTLFDRAQIGYLVIDADGIIEEINLVGAALLMTDRKSLEGRPIYSFIVPEWLNSFRSYTRRTIKGTPHGICDLKLLRKDGSTVDVRLNGIGILYPSRRKHRGSHYTLIDISDLKQSKHTLQKNEEEYRAIFENAVMGVFQTTPSGRYQKVNPALARMYGYESTDAMMESITDIEKQQYVHPEDRGRLKRLYENSGCVERFETEIYRKDGSKVWIAMNARAVKDEEGNILYFEGTTENITARKRSEEELRRSKLYVERVANAIPNILYVYELGHDRVQYISDRVFSILGYTPDEIGKMGRGTPAILVHPDYHRSAAEYLRLLSMSGEDEVIEAEIPVRHKDGQWRWMRIRSLVFMRHADGSAKSFVGTAEDITQHRLVEKERSRLIAAVQQAPEGMLITDGKFIIEYVNPAFLRITGYEAEELVGSDVRLIRGGQQPDSFYESLRAIVRGGDSWTDIYPIKRKNGTVCQARTSVASVRNAAGEIINYVMHCRDITEQLRLEEGIRQAQKMEAIGTLAGGIAHDFNNILAGIIGFAEMVLEDIPPDSKEHRRLERALKGAYRGRDLVKQILAFSRRTPQVHKNISLDEVIEDGLKLLRPALPSTINIKKTISAMADVVLADPVQIHQILMNLCANAAYAMRDVGGTLSINLSEELFSDSNRLPCSDMKPGAYVIMSVGDTGCGIEPETLERIFDPFFTTKAPGEGTGMGLSVVHGIAKSYGGSVTVKSLPGEGSTFSVYLPKASGRPDSEVASSPATPRGNEHVLFVDDEESLAELGRDRLTSLGYNVLASTNSREILEIFKAGPHTFDLVITDFTMPHLTGIKLAEELRKIRNDIPIILCTGHADVVSSEEAQRRGIEKILLKPFTKSEMAKAVRAALDNKNEVLPVALNSEFSSP